jgi:hypothetical protein
MVTIIRGQLPTTRSTVSRALALFALGCLLAILEWRLPDVVVGSGVDLTRLAPLLVLGLLVPAALLLVHRRHPWPSWLSAVSLELLAGLTAYSLVYHVLPRNEPDAIGEWGSWAVTVLSFVAIWLLAAGVASIGIAATHLIWKPRIEHACRQCGYLLVGLSDDRCPECGRSTD